MKKILILTLIMAGSFSCIKKKALKYDPELVGTWVSNQDGVNTWLEITSDGQGHYSTYGNDEADETGEVKYSVFERKMWVGKKKFKVRLWLTGSLDEVYQLQTKEYETLKDTLYDLDRKMILESTGVLAGRSITFYRIRQSY